MERDLAPFLSKDLMEKIVLLSGPRQVGKTTLSKSLPFNFEYLNYDSAEDRKIIEAKSWDRKKELIIFDELHKKKKWKSWIKGVYDTEGSSPHIMVTGSARLDILKKGGDSLAGRHYHLRLHPITVGELKNLMSPDEALERIMITGGFPEPFLKNSATFAKRWRSIHLERILKDDLLEIEQVRNLKLIEILTDLLAERVGSTVSYSSLARDLEISPHTVKKWISILEALYVIFVVPSYSKNIARAILKEPKIYFYDVGRIKNDPAARLENTVALALLKKIQNGQDLKGEKSYLYYLRDKEKREVDFVTQIDGKLIDLVEVKLNDSQISQNLKYFNERLNVQSCVQVVKSLKRNISSNNITVCKASQWLASLD